MSYHLTTVRMLLSRIPQTTNVDKDIEKRAPMYTVGRNVIWCCHHGNIKVPQKTKNTTTIQPSKSISVQIFKENKNSNLKMHAHQFP